MAQNACPACGRDAAPTARFCTRCGTVLNLVPPSAVDPGATFAEPQPLPRNFPPSFVAAPYAPPPAAYRPPAYPVAPPVERKDKTVSVVLAVFLGFWAWLYTYKRDAWKFWLHLGLTLTLFNPLWTWLLLFLPNIALYIWTLIDVAARPQSFYDHYPHA